MYFTNIWKMAKISPEQPFPREDRTRQRLAETVIHYARGNVTLQHGWYQTAEDVEKMKQDVMSHTFLVR